MRDEGCTGTHHNLEDEGNRYSWTIRYTIAYANDITRQSAVGERSTARVAREMRGRGKKKKEKKSEMSVREMPPDRTISQLN